MTKPKVKKKTNGAGRWRGKNGQMLAYYINMSEGERAALDRLEKAYGVSKAAILRSLIVRADWWAQQNPGKLEAIGTAVRTDFERKYGRKSVVA